MSTPISNNTSELQNLLSLAQSLPSADDKQDKVIQDRGGYFSDDTVEGALQELGAAVQDIPSKTSELVNDSGFLTQHQDISGKLNADGNGSNVTVAFTTASTRGNITSGGTLATAFGKIAKFFSDLKSVAFSGSYGDLSNKPTKLSEFTNDEGYITASDVPGVDYIVETGTSGIWTYRKWNSGLAECWGKQTINTKVSKSWNGVYDNDTAISQVTYPFVFIEPPVETVNVTSQGTDYSCQITIYSVAPATGGAQTTSLTNQYCLSRPSSVTDSRTFRLNYNVIGRWK